MFFFCFFALTSRATAVGEALVMYGVAILVKASTYQMELSAMHWACRRAWQWLDQSGSGPEAVPVQYGFGSVAVRLVHVADVAILCERGLMVSAADEY